MKMGDEIVALFQRCTFVFLILVSAKSYGNVMPIYELRYDAVLFMSFI